MPPDANDSLKNVLVDGIVREVHEAWQRKSYRATLILAYTAIDAMAYLTMAADKTKATRADFVAWADKYLRFRDAKAERTLTLPGLELYAARCALVHTYGTEADLHKDGTVQRQIGYADEMLPEIAQKEDVPNLVIVSVRGLLDALHDGIAATLKDFASNEEQRKLAATRLYGMVHHFPMPDQGPAEAFGEASRKS